MFGCELIHSCEDKLYVSSESTSGPKIVSRAAYGATTLEREGSFWIYNLFSQLWFFVPSVVEAHIILDQCNFANGESPGQRELDSCTESF